MKIFKSIKWRLQLWYALILLILLGGFGFTAYLLQRRELFSRIDGELDHRFALVANWVHPPRPGPPPFGRPPPRELLDGMPPPDDPRFSHFQLPPQSAALFTSSDPHNFYFIIFRDGRELASSTNKPVPVPTLSQSRLLVRSLPSGEDIWIGCSIRPELTELNVTALELSGAGVIILLLGLVGGWLISSRAIRPVENISATAVRIAAGDLSRRINVDETGSELGRLAAVLNSTFERLESAFTQQKQFASDAAHELRTPVSVILTQTQTALGRERDAKDYKQTIETCERAAQRMRKLIGALLELARLDAGQEPVKRAPFDFLNTVGECVELVRPLAEARGIRINVDASPLEITGNAEKLSLVVTNLLTNAIEYNHDGGAVKVVVRRDGSMAILTVGDTGRGISREDLPRVFERFYRAEKSRSSGNAGLGLAISKAIVAAHGGTIDVASDEHAGAVFTVRLPV